MKILVIGGTRYFGKRFVHRMIEAGHHVTVLSRGTTQDDFGARVERIHADRRDAAAFKKGVGNLHFDAVVDQVCMNADEARAAIEALAGRASHYVMTSTLSVYDFHGNLNEADFDGGNYQPQTPTNPMESYKEGKRAAEAAFLQAPFPCAFPRFPVVLGEDDYTLRLFDQVKKIYLGKPLYFPNIEAHFCFINSADAARALAWLVENKKEGPYNFSSPETLKLKELVALIEQATGQKAHLLDHPSEEAWSPFGVPSDWSMNVEKARREGFVAQSLAEWLPALIQKFAGDVHVAR
ncbi:NAD-dependent epimerase/dehydratase family protein [Bdellovibrio sp. 22V]|uniref:NAD-dependent epimerase/dehydratase family protein n=1 Tax=Bdellovibrio sp. 22V TaxID=3044166 RepID=UPI002543552A|nr:NAD-dependent epimerase/dehydratase family protein [Bdellovibrio sp. 22V]WII72815.1 NAD-dependent epimerase/dehydratase family protein [Bdellovibrio sp. 22V]